MSCRFCLDTPYNEGCHKIIIIINIKGDLTRAQHLHEPNGYQSAPPACTLTGKHEGTCKRDGNSYMELGESANERCLLGMLSVHGSTLIIIFV